MTSKNNRAPLLCYTSFLHNFKAFSKLKLELVRKQSIQVKIGNFLSLVILKFERLPWKTIGHLSYATSKFKLCASFCSHQWIQTRVTVQFRSKLEIFGPAWPWNLRDDLEQGKSEGFDSCDRPSNLTQIGFKIGDFSAHVTLTFNG